MVEALFLPSRFELRNCLRRLTLPGPGENILAHSHHTRCPGGGFAVNSLGAGHMKNRNLVGRFLIVLVSFASLAALAPAQESKASIETGFQDPPASARPRVWWHWMNGNITKEGIKLDLEWMHRVGIRGFQNFDAALNTPKFVDQRLVYMTPEWKDAFQYATTLAGQLGLEEAIAGSPGWSESGGPWVKPNQGMKKLVWSELRVEGG